MHALQINYRLEDDGDLYGAFVISWKDNAPPLNEEYLNALYAAGHDNNSPHVMEEMRKAIPQMAIAGTTDPLIAEQVVAGARASGGMVWTTTDPLAPTTDVRLIWGDRIEFCAMVDVQAEEPEPATETVTPTPADVIDPPAVPAPNVPAPPSTIEGTAVEVPAPAAPSNAGLAPGV